MSPLSFRWRLLLPTLIVGGLVAAALVAMVHARTQAQLLRSLQHALSSKAEEVQSVLAATHERVELASFVELEITYRNSPYEYFYELSDEQGRPLLRSRNLSSPLAAEADGPAADFSVVPHPGLGAERVLVHRQRLPEELAYAGVTGPVLCVAVCLAPYEAALRSELWTCLVAAVLSLSFLALALWLVIAHSLRSVSAITRHASAITSSNLRERLPQNGSGDELDRLAGVLNMLFAGLERSLRQMEDFTSDAAHQLRTPLTRIRGELDLLLSGPHSMAVDDVARLEEARGELERLGHTCGRLLLLARLDRGALEDELRREELDLAELAGELVEQMVPLALDKGVQLSLANGERLPIRCSRALLSEALLNLLDNAIRHTPCGGRVDVVLARARGRVLLSVRDGGPGVPVGERERLFGRFARGVGSTGTPGTGLGLAIVRGIARAHRGDVRLDPAHDGGACFELSLPA